MIGKIESPNIGSPGCHEMIVKGNEVGVNMNFFELVFYINDLMIPCLR